MAAWFTRKIFYFLSNKGTEISNRLIAGILSSNIAYIESESPQKFLFAVSDGVRNITVGILGTTTQLISDFSLMTIMVVGLMIIDPLTALSTVIMFGLISLLLHFLMRVRAESIGAEIYELTVKNNEKILEALSSFRESVVHNRRRYYLDQIKGLRSALSGLNAEVNFQPYVSKYVFEVVTTLSFLALAAFEFVTKNSVHAVSILVIFMAATSRIAPAALRCQQGLLAIKNAAGSSKIVFKFLEETKETEVVLGDDKWSLFKYPGFRNEIRLESIDFHYGGDEKFKFVDLSITFEAGQTTAIVGPSGAGKSTLVDIALGILLPNTGRVLVSDTSPSQAFSKWGGAISYLPQEIYLAPGTVRDNIILGYPRELIQDSEIWEALELARLANVVSEFQKGLDTPLGENGLKLSGGQRQRIGIARALFTKPKILVLDEATSALDAQTELEISQALDSLSHDLTLIIIAHRLATVRNADKVVYLEAGKIVSVGKFEEVRKKVANFDSQAKLMGL